MLWTIACIAALAAVSWTYLVLDSADYFESRRARDKPAWLSELYLSARHTLGEYREPPSNDEMIRYFHAHEREFEKLVEDYYAIIARAHATERFPDRTELMKFQLAELGLKRVGIGGAAQNKSVHGFEYFQILGMELRLFDRGGSFAQFRNAGKAYIYVPRTTDQPYRKRAPVADLIATGVYSRNVNMTELTIQNRGLGGRDCGMQAINDNWAVVHSINISN